MSLLSWMKNDITLFRLWKNRTKAWKRIWNHQELLCQRQRNLGQSLKLGLKIRECWILHHLLETDTRSEAVSSPFHDDTHGGKALSSWREVPGSGCPVCSRNSMFPKLNSLTFTFPIPQKGFPTLDDLWQLRSPGHRLIFPVLLGHCLHLGPTASVIIVSPGAGSPASRLTVRRTFQQHSAAAHSLPFKHVLSMFTGKAKVLLLAFKALYDPIRLAKLASLTPLSNSMFPGHRPVLSQLHGFAQVFLLARCLTFPNLQRFSLSAVSLKVSLTQMKLQLPSLKAHFILVFIICNQIKLQEGKKLWSCLPSVPQDMGTGQCFKSRNSPYYIPRQQSEKWLSLFPSLPQHVKEGSGIHPALMPLNSPSRWETRLE